jgi:hypothetical protein
MSTKCILTYKPASAGASKSKQLETEFKSPEAALEFMVEIAGDRMVRDLDPATLAKFKKDEVIYHQITADVPSPEYKWNKHVCISGWSQIYVEQDKLLGTWSIESKPVSADTVTITAADTVTITAADTATDEKSIFQSIIAGLMTIKLKSASLKLAVALLKRIIMLRKEDESKHSPDVLMAEITSQICKTDHDISLLELESLMYKENKDMIPSTIITSALSNIKFESPVAKAIVMMQLSQEHHLKGKEKYSYDELVAEIVRKFDRQLKLSENSREKNEILFAITPVLCGIELESEIAKKIMPMLKNLALTKRSGEERSLDEMASEISSIFRKFDHDIAQLEVKSAAAVAPDSLGYLMETTIRNTVMTNKFFREFFRSAMCDLLAPYRLGITRVQEGFSGRLTSIIERVDQHISSLEKKSLAAPVHHPDVLAAVNEIKSKLDRVLEDKKMMTPSSQSAVDLTCCAESKEKDDSLTKLSQVIKWINNVFPFDQIKWVDAHTYLSKIQEMRPHDIESLYTKVSSMHNVPLCATIAGYISFWTGKTDGNTARYFKMAGDSGYLLAMKMYCSYAFESQYKDPAVAADFNQKIKAAGYN